AAFFARQNTKTPMKFALMAIAINAGLSISLFPTLGFISVPIGTIVAAWVEVSCLAFLLIQKGYLQPHLQLLSRILRMLVMAVGLGGLLTLALAQKDQLLHFALGQEWILLFELTAVGILLYGAFSLLTGAVTLRHLKPVAPAS
ncbi:MAG: lipid II flippase MurJ, partial [Pseudomonadota bacterium]